MVIDMKDFKGELPATDHEMNAEALHNNDLSRVASNLDGSYTENNKKMTQYYLHQVLKNKPNAVILEIGVDNQGHARNKELSSTRAILEIKPKDATYIGIDLESRTYLDNKENNVYTLQCASQDMDKVRAYLKEIGVDHIDFYFIDGWHSILQCLIEWQYTDLLSPNGIVALHDTNHHLGPKWIVENINPDMWTVATYPGEEWKDFGIGFVWRKENDKVEKYVQD